MADYHSPTVIQPAIPVADITPLERLLLSHIFQVEAGGDGLYFYEDEGPAATIWLDRTEIDAALARSPATAESAAAGFVREQLARLPADNVEIELDLSSSLAIYFSGHRAPLAQPALRHRGLLLHLLENAPGRVRRHGRADYRERDRRQIDQRHHRRLPGRG